MSLGDFAIKPIAPPLDIDEKEQDAVIDHETQMLAEVISDPKFSVLEKKFIAAIEKYSLKPDARLLANEYKIKSLADEQTRSELLSILQEIQDAVTAVEGTRTGDN